MLLKRNKIQGAVAHFGTPLFLYDSEEITRSYNQLITALGSHAEVFYSLKANPNLSITAFLGQLGARAEVCSLAELESVLEIGFSSENIIFVGPAKSEEEIQKAIDAGIYALVCESFSELERIADYAQQSGQTANIALRINPDFTVATAPLKMGGRPSQFGLELADFPDALTLCQQKNYLNCRGLHVYNGTRILNSADLAQNTQRILELAQQLEQQYSFKLEMLDMGGGFGVPYFPKESSLDMESLGKLVQPALQAFKESHPDTRLIFESGRYLVATSGYFITQVVDVKQSHGEQFIVVDGGTNCHMAAVGTGSFLKRNYPLDVIQQTAEANETSQYNVVGPLCTPGDLVAKNIELPKVNRGDLLVIAQSGAYGPTASPVNFLSHGYPAEALIHDNKFLLIRERDFSQDLRAKQRLLSTFHMTRETIDATN